MSALHFEVFLPGKLSGFPRPEDRLRTKNYKNYKER